ncbi:MAG: hypothetical protein FD122_3724, partial [Stygiobacter sp.]
MKKFIVTFLFTFLLSSSYVFAQAPANDECSGATVISALPYNAAQNTRLATANVNDPNPSCNDTNALGKAVWYKYTPTTNQGVYFSTIGSTPTADFDVILSLWTGTCGSLTEVKCNDDAKSTRQA